MGIKRLFGRLKQGLAKTRSLFGGVARLLRLRRTIDDQFLEELEEQLLLTDMGPEVAVGLVDELRDAHKNKQVADDGLVEFVKDRLKARLVETDNRLLLAESGPSVVMVTGVNGVGKTTSIAKLAMMFRNDGKHVVLAASDTFRAAAVEQLELWSQRVGVEIVKNDRGADPASVAHDACDRALACGADVVIVDTAGRLHTQENLMRELAKIHRVIGRQIEGAPHEVLLVLDATTGQNAIAQAQMFQKAVQVSGIFLAKLDGTAKGGIVIAIKDKIDVPVKFVGLGEKPDDIEPFNPDAFVEALFA